MDKPFKVYNVIEGPIHTNDIPDWDDEKGWLMVCLVEQDNGALMEEEIIFDTFDEAYEVVKWFKSQIAPHEVWNYV